MERKTGSATTIAAGILCSRMAGFVRDALLAFFFGAGPHSDVFRTVLRGPNLLQNLLGEQTLSASFIPVYSRFLEDGREREAGKFAGAVFGLLTLLVAGLVLAGVVLARPIVAVVAPGYLADAAGVAAGTLSVDRYELAVQTIRWIFPMTGLLVLSAWALGVLNSHRRFFLPYFAPTLWNAAIIAGLLFGGSAFLGPGGTLGISQIETTVLNRILLSGCVGALVGGGIQFLVQLPLVIRLLRGFHFSISTRVAGIKEAFRAFLPLLAGRGVVQLSGYLDLLLASLLAAGAVASIGWAQSLYLMPISLFGMSVAAAALPELSRQTGAGEEQALSNRAIEALRQAAFLTVPTCLGYLLFGYLIVGGIYRRGQFGFADNWLVYLTLAGYSLGMIASVISRVVNNVLYARGETRVAARIAIERVILSALVGVGFMLVLDRVTVSALIGGLADGNRDLRLGAVGLSLGAGLAAWYELWRLNRAIGSRIREFSLPWRKLGRMMGLALVAAVPGGAIWIVAQAGPRILVVLLVVGVYAAVYLLLAPRFGLTEGSFWLARWRTKTKRNEEDQEIL